LAPLSGQAGTGGSVAGAATAAGANGPAEELDRKRRLLADIFRLIGQQVKGDAADNGNGQKPNGNGAANADAGNTNGHGDGNGRPHGDSADLTPVAATLAGDVADLSPRMLQTLRSLLEGDSEKQAAAKLGLSPHTIHVYVKALYKRYNVSSRGELLARWVKR
jgi:DNA-binding CsgD family transcriptional regulator